MGSAVQWLTMAGKVITLGLLLLLLPFLSCQEVKDDSRVTSVAWTNNSFQVLPGLNYLDSVLVWANLTDDQENNGWKYLEITTNPSQSNEIQAKAAGFAEGYLTRNFIYHYYQEFFSNLLCVDDESKEGCRYFQDKLSINEKYIQEKYKKNSGSDYWKMVQMFYLQMDGITEGFLQKSEEDSLPYADFDVKHGIKFINFLVDFFDYLAKFKEGKKLKQTKPSCSVLIKYLAEEREI